MIRKVKKFLRSKKFRKFKEFFRSKLSKVMRFVFGIFITLTIIGFVGQVAFDTGLEKGLEKGFQEGYNKSPYHQYKDEAYQCKVNLGRFYTSCQEEVHRLQRIIEELKSK